MTPARLGLLAAILCLALSASPAMAATTAPTLIAPTASSAHNSPLSIEYELPEAGSNGAIIFTPAVGSPISVTLSSPALAAGKHHFLLDLGQLAGETANVTAASATSLPDGEYTVSIRYQNLAAEPAAFAAAEKVKIKTFTGAPTLNEPTAGQTFRKSFTVAYSLPEAALPNSVRLVLIGTHAGLRPLLLSNASAGAHTAEIVPSNPSTGIGIASASTERLPADSYQLSLSYQDALGNPVAITVPIEATIGYPLCKAGGYSASGEEPCSNAPKGFYVPLEGATLANECPLGHFAAAEGLSECLLAMPGHYVPGTGAKAQLECEQGTYRELAGASSCLPAPLGHYAPKGAVTPTACVAGRFDAHTNSPSAEFCEFDSPGWYSGEGAAEPIPCIPGKYAFAYGSEQCLPAPPGSYVSSIGASDPTPCPAGTFSPVTSSVSCTTTPENTFSTGGAFEATPCPPETHSPAGASSCTAASKDAAADASSATTSTTAAKPTTTTASATPPVLISPAPGATSKLAIAAARRGTSLVASRRQRYVLTCSTATTVQVRTAAVIRAGGRQLVLAGARQTLRCKPAKAIEAVATFKLTAAAKRLLHTHGVSVKLTVQAYAPGATSGTPLAGATVRGKP